MICNVSGEFAYLVEYSKKEFDELHKLLTFQGYPERIQVRDDEGEFVRDSLGEIIIEEVIPVSSLLLFNSGKFYFYKNLFQKIKDLVYFKLELAPGSDLKKFDLSAELFEKLEYLNNKILPNIELLDFQVHSIKKSLIHMKGIINVSTGGGKTEIILGTLKFFFMFNLIKKGIIIVPTVNLATQLQERAFKRGFSSDEVGTWSGEKKQIGSVTVIVAKTAMNNIEFVQDTDFIGFDEGHHLRAEGWTKLFLTAKKAKYKIAWTGSPFQNRDNILKDRGDAVMCGLLGEPIVIINQPFLRTQKIKERALLATPVIYFHPIFGRMMKFKSSFTRVYNNFIMNNTKRNDEIVKFVNFFRDQNLKVVITVQQIEHAKKLMKLLNNYNVACIFGGNLFLEYNEERKIVESKIKYEEFNNKFENTIDILIASQVLDEGVDLPSINALIIAGGGKSTIKVLQRIGRGVRGKLTGVNKVYVVDFEDKGHIYTFSHSKKRKDIYKEDIKPDFVDNIDQFLKVVKTDNA